MNVARALALLPQVLRAEGPLAVRDRALDRCDEWLQRRRFRLLRRLPARPPCPPVLNVLPSALGARRGGVPLQLQARLREEARERPTALLWRSGNGWRLEVQHRAERWAALWPGPEIGRLPELDRPALDVLREAAALVGAPALHLETAHGLPLRELGRLAEQAPLVLSIQDFALFCPRPDLLRRPGLVFCGYCADLDRCAACLRAEWPLDRGFQADHRLAGWRLLNAARAAIYPSAFLREQHRRLFPGLDPRHHHAIEPGCAYSAPMSRAAVRAPRHVAFVGAMQPHKGGLVFEELVRRLRPSAGLRWSALGRGDPELLTRLRALPGVRVRGYYRAGSLPRLLRGLSIDLALLLSTSPESYCLTLDECLAAGVPVLAFDHGAVGERLRRIGGGHLVPPEKGVQGVADALRAFLAGDLRLEPAADPRAQLSTPRRAAAAHLALYRSLGLEWDSSLRA